MNSRPFRLVTLALPLLFGTVACGSSDDDSTPPPAVSDNDPANTELPAESSPGTNADVEKYCAAVDEYVEANKQLLADPTSVDVEAITRQSQDLIAAAAALVTSTTGEDAARVQECSGKFAEIAG